MSPVWRSIAVFAAAVLVSAVSCVRRETPASPRSGDAAADLPAPSAAPDSAQPATRPAADLERVGRLKTEFDEMLKALRQSEEAAVPAPPNVNAVDLAEFLRGKSERDLAAFALEIRVTHPAAAKQIAEHVITNTADIAALQTATEALRLPLLLVGTERDAALVQAALDRLLAGYDELADSLSADSKRMEDWFTLFHAYAVVLHDPTIYGRLAQALRASGPSDFELSLADWAECLWIASDPSREDVGSVSRLCAQIKERGLHGDTYATRTAVDRFLADAPGCVNQARQSFSQIKPFYTRPMQAAQPTQQQEDTE